MKRCIACGAPLWETPLLTLDNMPASAQHMPDKDHVDEDQGLTLDLCQCMGCGLVQFDCEPVDFYRDVIRDGGAAQKTVQAPDRNLPFRRKAVYRGRLRTGRFFKSIRGISGRGSRD